MEKKYKTTIDLEVIAEDEVEAIDKMNALINTGNVIVGEVIVVEDIE